MAYVYEASSQPETLRPVLTQISAPGQHEGAQDDGDQDVLEPGPTSKEERPQATAPRDHKDTQRATLTIGTRPRQNDARVDERVARMPKDANPSRRFEQF